MGTPATPSNPMNVYFTVTGISGSSSVSSATFAYYKTYANGVLSNQYTEKASNGANLIVFGQSETVETAYDSIAYNFVPGQSSAGVSFLSALSGGTVTNLASSNVATVFNPAGTTTCVNLKMKYTQGSTSYLFQSPDPQSQNEGP